MLAAASTIEPPPGTHQIEGRGLGSGDRVLVAPSRENVLMLRKFAIALIAGATLVTGIALTPTEASAWGWRRPYYGYGWGWRRWLIPLTVRLYIVAMPV